MGKGEKRMGTGEKEVGRVRKDFLKTLKEVASRVVRREGGGGKGCMWCLRGLGLEASEIQEFKNRRKMVENV